MDSQPGMAEFVEDSTRKKQSRHPLSHCHTFDLAGHSAPKHIEVGRQGDAEGMIDVAPTKQGVESGTSAEFEVQRQLIETKSLGNDPLFELSVEGLSLFNDFDSSCAAGEATLALISIPTRSLLVWGNEATTK